MNEVESSKTQFWKRIDFKLLSENQMYEQYYHK